MSYEENPRIILSIEPGKPRQITTYEMRFYDAEIASKITETAQEILENIEEEWIES